MSSSSSLQEEVVNLKAQLETLKMEKEFTEKAYSKSVEKGKEQEE